jgi:aquaporin Z
MNDTIRKAVAEALGTFVLVFFAVGTAVFGVDVVGGIGVAVAFGFVLLALAYALGPLSGCHVNPAVTLGVLIRGGITVTEAAYYWVAQVVGAIVAGGLLALLTSDFGDVEDQTGALGTTGYGETISVGGAFVLEAVLTFLLVLVVLLVTARAAAPGFAGLAIGLVLTVIILTGFNLTGPSVNPARSIGPALFEGGDAISELWLFILAPLVGAAIAAFVAPLFEPPLEAATVGRADTSVLTDPTGADVPQTTDVRDASADYRDDLPPGTSGPAR